MKLGSLRLNKLQTNDMEWLQRDITLEEVEYVLNISSFGKAPGPDGFGIECIKLFWNDIKQSVMKCYEDFISKGTFLKGLNSSFVALIPKKVQPTLISEYRPISLINSVRKLFMKLMVEILSLLLGKLVSDNQFGFMRGRQASLSILIVSEVYHNLKNGSAKGLIFKIDFEEAFDSVNWAFLFQLLEKFGVGTSFISILKIIILKLECLVWLMALLLRNFLLS